MKSPKILFALAGILLCVVLWSVLRPATDSVQTPTVSQPTLVMAQPTNKKPQNVVSPDLQNAKLVIPVAEIKIPDLVRTLVFLSRGQILAAATDTRGTLLIDVKTKKISRTLAGSHPVSFSADEKTMASMARTSRIIDVRTNRVLKSFEDNSSKINGSGVFAPIALSPDGKLLLTGGEDPESTWQPPDFKGAVSEASYNRMLAFKLWDTRTGQRLQYWPGSYSNSEYVSVFFTQDSKSFFERRSLLNVKTGKRTLIVTGKGRVLSERAFNQSRSTLAVVRDLTTATNVLRYPYRIEIYNLRSGKLQKSLSAHLAQITNMALSDDAKLLATYTQDSYRTPQNNIHIYNTSTGKIIASFEKRSGVYAMAFSPNNDFLVSSVVISSSNDQQNLLTFWRLEKQTKGTEL